MNQQQQQNPNVLQFVFWDANGHNHPWMPKYAHNGFNGPVKPILERPGCWVKAPGFVFRDAENHRPTKVNQTDILNKLKNYYQSLVGTIPEAILQEQMNGWTKLSITELEKQSRAFFTKVAIQQRDNKKNA